MIRLLWTTAGPTCSQLGLLLLVLGLRLGSLAMLMRDRRGQRR
jgi:hypothetical protein